MTILLEGEGVLRAGNKLVNNAFETKDLEKWDEYLKKQKFTLSGSAPCILCSTQVTFTDQPYGHNVLCDNCKEDLKKQK